MAQAVRLAHGVRGCVWPNPPVGCIIVREGMITGRGQTQPGGRPHAERVALGEAAALARGATLYVTLEPCCHWGRTPPCVEAIIAAGVHRVVASTEDPDPRVNGGGFAALREAGITVDVGLAAAEAQRVAAGFFHRVHKGRPLIVTGAASEARAVPDGIDAALWRDGQKTQLTMRWSWAGLITEELDGTMSSDALLALLGRRGLTTLHVGADDVLARYAIAQER